MKISNIEVLYDDWKQKATSHFALSYWKDGKKITERNAEPFFPYFYIPEDAIIDDDIKKYCRKIEHNFDTWDFKKAQKLTFDQVDRDTFFQIREAFKITYEDDVTLIMRHLVDNDIQYSSKQRLGIIDIEVMKGPTSLKPLEAHEPITTIVIHDSFTDQFYIFAWSPIGKESKKVVKNRRYFISANERQMLLKFSAFLQYMKFDIFSGWNLKEYDWPYIITRFKNMQISPHKLSYLGRAMAFKGHEGTYVKIFGSSIIDAMTETKKRTDLKKKFNLNSYSLKAITTKLLTHSKLDTVLVTKDTFEEKFEALLEYCVSDVDLVRELNEEYNLLTPLFKLQDVVPLPLEDLQYMSRIADAFMLKRYHNKIVFPSKRKRKHVDYEGGLVLTPKAGFYDNVLYLDFKSHYLSVISAFNVSPELKIVSENRKKVNFQNKEALKGLAEELKNALEDKREISFRQDKKGILAEIVEEIRKTREHYKTLRNTFLKNSIEWSKYDDLQSSFKTLSLTFYGMFGFKSFRLFDPDVAAFITEKARELLRELKVFYEDNGFEVIYGDTDSIFVHGGDNTEKALKILNDFNIVLNEKYPSSLVELEDTFMRAIFFDKKKRYMGIRKDGSLKMTGIDPIRSDIPSYFKTRLEELVKIMLKIDQKNIIEEVDKIEAEIIKDLPTLRLDQICEWKGLGRPFRDYKVKTPNVRAALFSNEFLETNYTVGDKIPFIWVCNDKRTNVVALPEENSENLLDDFEWNRNRAFQKSWLKKKEMFLEVLNDKEKK